MLNTSTKRLAFMVWALFSVSGVHAELLIEDEPPVSVIKITPTKQDEPAVKKKSALFIDDKPIAEYEKKKPTKAEKPLPPKFSPEKTEKTVEKKPKKALPPPPPVAERASEELPSNQVIFDDLGAASEPDFIGVNVDDLVSVSPIEAERNRQVSEQAQLNLHNHLIMVDKAAAHRSEAQNRTRPVKRDYLAELSGNPFIVVGIALFFLIVIALILLITNHLVQLNTLKMQKRKAEKARLKALRKQQKEEQKNAATQSTQKH